jgi:echinoderm microtubule-associated protein-like 1/2
MAGKYEDAIQSAAPWRDVASILTPSVYANATMTKVSPEASSEITWVYGYQSEKSKNNLRYTSAKGHCIVYHVGRFGIVYSFDSHKQSLFSGHRDEIISLSVHPDGEMVATGDSSKNPRLFVWSAVTKAVHFTERYEILACMFLWQCSKRLDNRGFHKNGIIHTAFSADGKQLASIGLDVFHSVAVYLWRENQMLYTSKVDKVSVSILQLSIWR